MFKGNKVYLVDKNGRKHRFFGIIPGLRISFKGSNSTIELHTPLPKFSRSRIKLKDNSFVSIGSSDYKIKKLEILGESQQTFVIGDNFFTWGCSLVSASEPNLKISIGNDCMFSKDIILRASDGHSIIDTQTNEILNFGKDITIGNNVWIAGNVMVLKGVNIFDNAIVGHGSIVTKNCDSNSVYVGNPARKVKSNVIWDRPCPYCNYNFPVDLVYLWCDINDGDFKKRKDNFIKNIHIEDGANASCRFIDNDELKYSLRSVERFAPWINKIYIVTDNQIPSWLDLSNEKIRVIDQTTLLPKDASPCFNSNAIEHCIVNIPNLSEQFLYANDDMFICKPVDKNFFFSKNGIPINRFTKPYKDTDNSIYIKSLKNASALIEKKFNKQFLYSSHHNIDAYRKSDIIACQKLFIDEINNTIHSHFRSENDIHRNIYSIFSIVKGGRFVYLDKFRLFSSQKDSIVLFPQSNKKTKKIAKYKPKLFCINDCEKTTDKDRDSIKEFLKELYSKKSTYEKE